MVNSEPNKILNLVFLPNCSHVATVLMWQPLVQICWRRKSHLEDKDEGLLASVMEM